MILQDIISINPEILRKILLEEIKKLPGISSKNIEDIQINNKNCSIDITITPFSLLTNINSIACELQQAINFFLTKQFDVKEGLIKINIFVLPETNKGENK